MRFVFSRRCQQAVFKPPKPSLFLRANGWGFFVCVFLFLATIRLYTCSRQNLGIPLALRTSGGLKR